MTSRSYRCVPESHSAGNAATSHPSEGRQCHGSSTVQIGSAELFPVLTHCSPSCWLTRQRAYRALLRKVKQADTTLSPRCHQRTGNPSPLRSAVGSWFSPLLIAVVTLGLPQEAAATFPAMPLSNLFANAVLRAQHLHLLAASPAQGCTSRPTFPSCKEQPIFRRTRGTPTKTPRLRFVTQKPSQLPRGRMTPSRSQ